MDAAVDVVLVVRGQRREHTQFDAAGITVLRYGADNLDGALGTLSSVPGFDDLAEGALAQEFQNLVCFCVSTANLAGSRECIHRSVRSASGTTM